MCGQMIGNTERLYEIMCWSQWPRGLTRGSAVARLLGLCVRIPQGIWMSVSCQVEVLLRVNRFSRGFLPNVVFLSVITNRR